jgi:hypothetical protein
MSKKQANPTKKNARQATSLVKKIEKVKDTLKGLQDKLDALQKAQSDPKPTEAAA